MPHYSVVCATLRESCCRNGYRSWPRLSAFLFSTDSLMPRFSYLASLEHKEKARESCPCLSRVSGSRIASPPKISNTEAHALITPNNNKSDINAMDVSHCLIVWRNEFARFDTPQIKRQSNVFSICMSPTHCPVKGLRRVDGANLQCFWNLKSIFFGKTTFFDFQEPKNNASISAESVKKKHFPQS